MLHKTSGIILQSTKYSDTSLIVKIYTLHFGMQSYMISGVRSKRSKNKANLFQPLTIVDLEVVNSEKSALNRVSEINLAHHYTGIPFDMIKSSVAMFLNELVLKAFKEPHPDNDLFEFLKSSFLILDLRTENNANFHLCFMMQLSRFLGFFPQGEFGDNTSVFDLQEGRFVNYIPHHPHYLNAKQSELFFQLSSLSYDTVSQFGIDRSERKQLLQALILYFQLHISGFGLMRSLEVLEEVVS